MCGGTHGSPWDISTYILLRIVGWDRHIALTCVAVPMGVPRISYIGQWDGIDTLD